MPEGAPATPQENGDEQKRLLDRQFHVGSVRIKGGRLAVQGAPEYQEFPDEEEI